MNTMKNAWVRLLTCCFTAILLLSIGAGAVDQTESTSRQDDLDYLYTTLKINHPDLFANAPETVFEARKSQIEQRLSTESSFDFALDCASLAALAKDSHTNISLGSSGYDLHICLFDMDLYDGSWVLRAIDSAHKSLLGSKITAINGYSMEQVVEKFGTILSADNLVKLQYSYWKMCYVLEPYQYLGIAKQGEPMRIEVQDSTGKTSTLTVSSVSQSAFRSEDLAMLSDWQTGPATTAYDKTKTYFAKELNSTTYYIQYNKCAEDKALPMKQFCQQVQAALDAGSYSLILVDLRNNGGGSDGVIMPLLRLLAQQREQGVQVAGLIGKRTFSSAIINSVELQEMGFALAGEATGGSVDHFGAVQSFKLPNSGMRMGISSKFISMSGYFDAASGKGVEPLQPDVKIVQTLSDSQAGRDTCVEKILENPEILKSAERADVPMTRGRFVGLLFQKASTPKVSIESQPFNDVLEIEWYLPALNWGKATQIARGDTTGNFASAHAVSWQQASVFLVRTADALKLQPTSVRSDAVPDTLKTTTWNKDAVQKAWRWGLLPEYGDFSAAPTRAQGETMINQLFAAK
ncbi:hypothetical protein [Oscillibacter sp.]|uniref:hypothetical protein n=1 Tax=Oscillibacter sp. TaxID=1945593 RepID=UPI0028A89692|nr:hypothetical protein [Oscillibacter sp.]